jgi:hypothetical protein
MIGSSNGRNSRLRAALGVRLRGRPPARKDPQCLYTDGVDNESHGPDQRRETPHSLIKVTCREMLHNCIRRILAETSD